MQDAGKFPPHKQNPNGDAVQDAQRAKQERGADGKPALKVSFERPETREALKAAEKSADKAAAHVAIVPEPAPAKSYNAENAGLAVTLLEKPDKSTIAETKAPERLESQTREVPSTSQLLAAPLLAIVAALATFAAGWSYMKLNETRSQLATATAALTTVEADKSAASQAKATAEKAIAAATAEKTAAMQVKATAEKALADAQSRLSTLEKTVADIKSALAVVVTTAAPESKPAVTPPAK